MLRTSAELRAVIEATYPFDASGRPLDVDQRYTLLASNANFELGIPMMGFCMASAAYEGSPQIIQASYTAVDQTGSNPKKLPPIEGVERVALTRPAAVGARRAAEILRWYVDDFGTDLVWLSLDHFTSPQFELGRYGEPRGQGGIYRPVAVALLEDAVESLKVDLSKDQFDAYVNYLSGDEFGEYARDFLGAVQMSEAAWAMIDTGETPRPVNLASTKWLVDCVRTALDNPDVIIEAEFSSTGSSGEEEAYAYWEKMDEVPDAPVMTDEERAQFRHSIITFVQKTSADAIAYEVGSKHAAQAGESFMLDIAKLRAIQTELKETMGRRIPYAGHGGTGFKWVDDLVGPIFKRNINTQHLYAGTMSQLEWVESKRAAILKREKKAVGRGRKVAEVQAQANSAVQLLKECRTWQQGPRFREMLKGFEARKVEYRDTAARE